VRLLASTGPKPRWCAPPAPLDDDEDGSSGTSSSFTSSEDDETSSGTDETSSGTDETERSEDARDRERLAYTLKVDFWTAEQVEMAKRMEQDGRQSSVELWVPDGATVGDIITALLSAWGGTTPIYSPLA
jgi:hypothetical protein